MNERSKGEKPSAAQAPALYSTFRRDIEHLPIQERRLRGPDFVESAWDQFVGYNREDLIKAGILTEGGFVNMTKHTRLLNGTIWQLYLKLQEVTGLTVLGIMGEATKLTAAESASFVKQVLARVNGRVSPLTT